MAYVGQMESYGKGVEVLEKLAGVEVCEAQLYRVTDTYGALLEAEIECEEPSTEESSVDEGEVVYAQMDGSMILTEEDWREVKVGRLFRENVLIPVVPYRTHLPLTSCEAAAGGLGRQLGLDEIRSWIAIPASVHPGTGMFVAKVQGRSMEPLIADGSLCVFRSNVTGSRSGRRLLIEKLGEFDEAARFTIKIYHSEKKQLAEDEWAHSTIRLEPLNPEFSAWELAPDEFRVVGELVSVLDAEE